MAESHPQSNVEIDGSVMCSRGRQGRRERCLMILLVIVCWPCIAIDNICRSSRPNPEEVERFKRSRGSDPPDPLPVLRRRALTLPAGLVPLDPVSQPQSSFFTRLSPEIRYSIYRHVLRPSGSCCLHVASTHRRVCSFACFEFESEAQARQIHGWQHACWTGRGTAADGTIMPRWRSRAPRQDIVLGMLCCCRRVYSEAVGLLYTGNTLNVRQTRTILDMQKCILPHRLRMFRSLHIDVPLRSRWKDGSVFGDGHLWPGNILTFWAPAWSVLAEMHGLMNLTVSLGSQTQRVVEVDRETLTHVMEPMMAVKHVPAFVLEILLPLPDGLLEDVLQHLGDPPFAVEAKDAF